MKVTTHLSLMPRLRLSEPIIPFPIFIRGVMGNLVQAQRLPEVSNR
jgi:hypothetical protein